MEVHHPLSKPQLLLTRTAALYLKPSWQPDSSPMKRPGRVQQYCPTSRQTSYSRNFAGEYLR